MVSSVIEIDLERVIYDVDYRQIQIERLLNEQNGMDTQLNNRGTDAKNEAYHDLSIPPFSCVS